MRASPFLVLIEKSVFFFPLSSTPQPFPICDKVRLLICTLRQSDCGLFPPPPFLFSVIPDFTCSLFSQLRDALSSTWAISGLEAASRSPSFVFRWRDALPKLDIAGKTLDIGSVGRGLRGRAFPCYNKLSVSPFPLFRCRKIPLFSATTTSPRIAAAISLHAKRT